MAIRTIAMIGTGTQGRAIALLVLRVGYRVILEDFSISTLKEGEASIRDALSKQFANVAISNEQSDHTLDWTNADSSRDAISNLSIRTSVQDAIRNRRRRTGNQTGAFHHLRQVRTAQRDFRDDQRGAPSRRIRRCDLLPRALHNPAIFAGRKPASSRHNPGSTNIARDHPSLHRIREAAQNRSQPIAKHCRRAAGNKQTQGLGRSSHSPTRRTR